MKQFITEPLAPTAQLCINKSRLKIHNKETEPTYYLQKGQEFSMEFYNPTKDVIMARIYLNGKAITQGGLVLKPGERVFLERYFDVAKKFQFDTYTVANTQEVKDAIENNGDFKVEFFRESTPPPIPYYLNGSYSTTIVNTGSPYQSNFFTNTCSTGTVNLRGNVNTTGSLQNIGATASNYSSNISTDFSPAASGTLGLASMDMMCRSSASLSDESASYKSAPRLRSLKAKKSIETGRVEEGSTSNQKIRTINKNFDSWAFHSVQYKLLPISQKMNTSEDINVAQYCVNCGSKTGKTDRFCAKCGTRI